MLQNINNNTVGVLIDTIKIASNALNINLFVKVDDEQYYYEQHFKDAKFFQKLITNKTIDTIAASTTSFVQPSDFCSCTKAFFEDTNIWITKNAKIISNFKLLFLVFQPTTWVLFVIPLLAFGIVIHITTIIKIDKKSQLTFATIILDLIKLVLDIPMIKLQRLHFLRMILLYYMWYGLVIGTYYKTKMTSLLSKPTYEKLYDNVDEMFKHNVKFLVVESIKNVLQNVEVGSNKPSTRHDLVSEVDCIKEIILYNNYTTHVKESYLKVHSSLASQIKIVGSKYLISVKFFYKFSASFPFREKIDRVIENMQSAGIGIKILRSYGLVNWITNEKVNISLSLAHLWSAFTILILGNVGGICVYGFEIFYSKFSQKNKYKKIFSS